MGSRGQCVVSLRRLKNKCLKLIFRKLFCMVPNQQSKESRNLCSKMCQNVPKYTWEEGATDRE